jgi:hypothetical protein
MSLRMRIVVALVLLALALLAILFLGSDVTSCLGPLGRTYVQSLADGCTKPGIGAAIPVAIGLVLAALLVVEPPSKQPRTFRLAIAFLAALVAVVSYLVGRPTQLTGPTSTGEVITVALPLDLAMVAVAAMVAGGFAWFASRWIRGRPSPR